MQMRQRRPMQMRRRQLDVTGLKTLPPLERPFCGGLVQERTVAVDAVAAAVVVVVVAVVFAV